ncbi:tellurite resistance/C4-dicarboxylate transporter family protein [Jatrophihabitans cynanchi]|jgi:tellurite resistance protein TehA-like permease|uniref:Tellurite resistance/C4-dicarboxylate transporter family protein n=1 Tax=Jatrophihabitans cynanchi TaxID=2944128 RepID=A0ABY7K1U7_9ACTN|nr:tellurite resistance/C4-dicarboxylate transporter family protein [Jatrophihabitans sp. SB3-54]WAX57577.1 tellurite resistance/C4-dicarboxylate transporter family protein [Jatrophihabitans sp. SB3-54]
MIGSVAARWLTETDLPPDVFAVVMATGIVSVAADDHRYPRISVPLAVLAAAAFVVLGIGLVLRVLARPHSAAGELTDPDVALCLFTSVAACTVLGVRFDSHGAAVWLLGSLALFGWLVLTPLAIRDVLSRPRTQLRDHAHGAWLLPAVATAGLAITAADLAIRAHASVLLVIAALLWLLALLIYLAVTWLIAWRAVAGPIAADEVTPDSWILMGALAISALAGAHLEAGARAMHVAGYLPWVRPLTIGVWILAGLWIPVLLYAEIWTVERRLGALHYTRVWWSAVFPIGMYAAANSALAVQFQLRSLRTISLVFFWVGFVVWLLVAVGLGQAFVRQRR